MLERRRHAGRVGGLGRGRQAEAGEDKRNRPVPEFDKVKDQVEQFVVRKAQADLVTKLRSEAKIEKMTPPADAKPAAPAAPKQ